MGKWTGEEGAAPKLLDHGGVPGDTCVMLRGGKLSAAGCTVFLVLSACSNQGPPPPSSTAAADAPDTTPPLCKQQIDTVSPTPETKIILGAVALAGLTGDHAIQTGNHGDADPSRRLFAKVGLQVRAGSSVNITVSEDSALDAAIGWRNDLPPTGEFLVPSCVTVADADSWLTYAGGIFVATPGCVTLQVLIGAQREDVAVGVGAPCPGQTGPAPPSDT